MAGGLRVPAGLAAPGEAVPAAPALLPQPPLAAGEVAPVGLGAGEEDPLAGGVLGDAAPVWRVAQLGVGRSAGGEVGVLVGPLPLPAAFPQPLISVRLCFFSHLLFVELSGECPQSDVTACDAQDAHKFIPVVEWVEVLSSSFQLSSTSCISQLLTLLVTILFLFSLVQHHILCSAPWLDYCVYCSCTALY